MIAPEDIPEDLIITVADGRKLGYCTKGIRAWCNSAGVDFRRFVRHGIPAREFAAYDERANEFVEKVVRNGKSS